MGERNQEIDMSDSLEDVFEPVLDLGNDDIEEFKEFTTEKQRLAEKRKRAEMRLEEKRLREELGDYDFHFDDY